MEREEDPEWTKAMGKGPLSPSGFATVAAPAGSLSRGSKARRNSRGSDGLRRRLGSSVGQLESSESGI